MTSMCTRSTLSILLSCCLVGALVSIAGCTRYGAMLRSGEARDLTLALFNGAREIDTGRPTQLNVHAMFENHETATTWRYDATGRANRRGHLRFRYFAFNTDLGEINRRNGVLSIPNIDPALLGREANVTVATRSSPALTAHLTLKIRFGGTTVVSYEGLSGSDGFTGSPPPL